MKSKYSLQEKYSMIMECRTSGLTDFQWCRQRAICPSTFYGWVAQVRKQYTDIPGPLGRNNTRPAAKQDIVKLEIVDDPVAAAPEIPIRPQTSTPYTVEISVGGSTTIRLTNDVNVRLMSQILSSLGTSL